MTQPTPAEPAHGSGSGKEKESEQEKSLTRLIAPIFAGFSLPTIITFVPATFPSPPWHDAILSLLLVATGLFMASIQLSIGRLYDNYNNLRKFRIFRAYLTVIGIGLVALALTFLVSATVSTLLIWLPLSVLLLGGVGPGLVMLFVKDQDA